MEIIYKSNAKQSNFQYVAQMFKKTKVVNDFGEIWASVGGDEDPDTNNVLFEKPITADLILDYPLTVVTKQTVTVNSLYDIIREIRKAYNEIYEDSIKYGIWGHYIYDLSISGIKIKKDESGKYLIDVSIDS